MVSVALPLPLNEHFPSVEILRVAIASKGGGAGCRVLKRGWITRRGARSCIAAGRVYLFFGFVLDGVCVANNSKGRRC